MNLAHRRSKVQESSEWTGIDYVLVEVDNSGRPLLQVRFLGTAPSDLLDDAKISITSVRADATPSEIGGEVTGGIVDADGDVVGCKIRATQVGEMTPYVLRIDHEQIDRCFRKKRFSFQAICERDIDCKSPESAADGGADVDFPVDYMARDFNSLRRALLEFASQRYPGWGDPVEADVVVTLLEAMSALGDEFSYYQDRIAHEAHLETATQRRSLRRLARLVDYRPFEGEAASGWLTVDTSGDADSVPAGTRVRTSDAEPLNFEVGESFDDIVSQRPYPVLGGRDELDPYLWCDDDETLAAGATEMWIRGDLEQDFDDAQEGKLRVLLVEAASDASQRPQCLPVTIVDYEAETDPLTETDTTYIRWAEDDALRHALDLRRTVVRVNLFPVLAGQMRTQRFIIGASPAPDKLPEAVERLGPDGSVTYRFTLPGSETVPLAWSSTPHVALRSIPRADREAIEEEQLDFSEALTWTWKPSFVFGMSSTATDRDFVLEAGSWRRINAHIEKGTEVPHIDYAGDRGMTIRFGDGELGRIPPRGTIFEVTYRLGNGTAFNVASHTITDYVGGPVLDDAQDQQPAEDPPEVDNPLPTEGGRDEESLDTTRADAPHAFRTITHRAVRPRDYAEAAQRLDWVQRAGARLRWTGSWSTVFVAPDARGEASLAPSRRRQLEGHLDNMRQVGRPLQIAEPQYVDLDLRLHLCVQPQFERSRVHRSVLEALFADADRAADAGFLHPDRFTFGAPLDRAALEGFVQAVPGVKAVERVEIRRQGWFDWREFEELQYAVSDREIVRISNDPARPNRGIVQLFTHGGI